MKKMAAWILSLAMLSGQAVWAAPAEAMIPDENPAVITEIASEASEKEVEETVEEILEEILEETEVEETEAEEIEEELPVEEAEEVTEPVEEPEAEAVALELEEEEIDPSVLIGVGKADITGPITDISTGYNSLGKIAEGILMRLNARAFVIDNGETPVVYASAEIVHMTESIKPGVMKKLKKDGYTRLTEENVMIAGTHCHSSSSNVSWYGLYDLVNGIPGYDDESYDVIVRGIATAIERAYDSRVPGTVSLTSTQMKIPYANRSADAFLANKNVADYGYEVNSDGSFSYETGLKAATEAFNHELAGLVFTDASGRDIGYFSFIGVHGTANSINNTLISPDHSGYAAYKVEKQMGDGFVAAFGQADSGDCSPNIVQTQDYHLDFLRPMDFGLTKFVDHNMIGEMEAAEAMKVINGGQRTLLSNTLDFNYTVIDFSKIKVDLSYVDDYYMPYDDLSKGYVSTCEPCIGAAMIAGDEEGAPVDNAEEGTVRHKFVWNEATKSYKRVKYDFSTIDLYGLEKVLKAVWPTAMVLLRSNKYDAGQMEKVVALAVGDLMQKAQPLQILRIGQVAIAGVSFEITYEAANRVRKTLEETLAPLGVEKVIIASHANSYSQYVTTREEFAAQHYEGSSNLFGPWTQAAMAQELDKLAQGMVKGEKAPKGAALRQSAPALILKTPVAMGRPLIEINYGSVVSNVKKSSYAKGETVSAVFSAVEPRIITNLTLEHPDFVKDYSYLEVQKLVNGSWETYLTDKDPNTYFEYSRSFLLGVPNKGTVNWIIDGDSYAPGTYRLVYKGISKIRLAKTGKDCIRDKDVYYKKFTVNSKQFNVE